MDFSEFIVQKRPDVAQVLLRKRLVTTARSKPPAKYDVVGSDTTRAIVGILLEHDFDVATKHQGSGQTLLHYVFYHTTDEMLDVPKLLLEKGADCNARDRHGVTPFHLALRQTNLHTIKWLVSDYQADITVADLRGQTALHYAATNCNAGVTKFVIARGIHVDCRDEAGFSPLHSAAKTGNLEACKILLSSGAKANVRSSRSPWELTPLTMAVGVFAQKFSAEIVQILLDHGADATDMAGGKTLLEIAQPGAHREYVRSVLARHMAKMKHQNLDINLADQHILETSWNYKIYYEKCLQEIEAMKHILFYNNVSVFSILMESDMVLSRYAKNEDLRDALMKTFQERRHEFPEHFPSLQERFCRIATNQITRNIAVKLLSYIFMFRDPPHPVITTIVSFLTKMDLEVLEV